MLLITFLVLGKRTLGAKQLCQTKNFRPTNTFMDKEDELKFICRFKNVCSSQWSPESFESLTINSPVSLSLCFAHQLISATLLDLTDFTSAPWSNGVIPAQSQNCVLLIAVPTCWQDVMKPQYHSKMAHSTLLGIWNMFYSKLIVDKSLYHVANFICRKATKKNDNPDR